MDALLWPSKFFHSQGAPNILVLFEIKFVCETVDSVTVVSHRWSPQTVIHLAAMFTDVPLSSEELRFVLEKIIRQFDDLDLRDIPSLVYQLLLLTEKVSLTASDGNWIILFY